MSVFAKVVYFSSCATIFAGTTYVVGISMAPPPTYKVSNEQRINKFDEIAESYESKTKKQEFYLGIGRWRRKLLKEAEGRVLEVGAGTGSNLELYPADACDEVIFCDRSPHMIAVAERKIRARLGYEPFRYPDYVLDSNSTLQEGGLAAPQTSLPAVRVKHSKIDTVDPTSQQLTEHETNAKASCCRLTDGLLPISDAMTLSGDSKALLAARAETIGSKSRARLDKQAAHPTEHLPASRATHQDLYAVACYPTEKLPFPSNSFDTVVDMFGLCSFDDPVRALTEMSRVCKPSGKILLLEHGRGTWEKMNDYLDKWAPRHAAMWGCWWNRDIRRYLRLSGVQQILRDEKHFGTTHYIVVKPYKSIAELKEAEATTKT